MVIITKLFKNTKESIDIYALSYIESGDEKDEKTPNNIVKSHVTITRKSLDQAFSHFPKKYQSTNWAIMPGNLDLAHIAFCNIFNTYDHYWFCEDDVRYSGDLNVLIDHFTPFTEVDLLATSFREHEPNFAHKHSLKIPENIGKNYSMRTSLPFFRISKGAIETLQDAYHKEWAGHHEIS